MRLQQILVNLVGNAIKFTERGEVALLVEQLRRDGETCVLRFSVTDTGIGMDQAQLGRVFAAFGQADASITRRFGGTGIGLTICQRLAGLMGGTIDVDSALGRGSRFSLTVPLVALADAPAAGGHGAMRLLVVDDNATSRDYLCRTIGALGWHADAAASGADCLILAGRRGPAYDAVLVDWRMPGMDGLQTLQALRALPGGAGRSDPARDDAALPVLLMVNACARDALDRQQAGAQAAAILIKPVTGVTLVSALQERMARRAGARLLLVEDNPLNQFVAKSLLEHAGATVEIAGDGQQAVDLLRADARRCDVVLMDMHMPVLDGVSATRHIRGELGLTLPVLAMTAGVMASERDRCMAAGMDDFIAKPIDVEQMLGVIERHLPASPPCPVPIR